MPVVRLVRRAPLASALAATAAPVGLVVAAVTARALDPATVQTLSLGVAGGIQLLTQTACADRTPDQPSAHVLAGVAGLTALGAAFRRRAR